MHNTHLFRPSLRYSSEQYCAYLRKSRADRDAELRGEDVLARHRTMLIELSQRIGKPITKFYEEVVSGDTIQDRPVMQELLNDVEQDMWAGVFVVEIERLARGNTRDQGLVADTFKYSGTQIITLTKTYDSDNESDEEYFEFGLFMSRREYKTINRRLQNGRITSVKEGKYVGGTAPYGYERVKIPRQKGYTLRIVESEANIVSMIFNWYCVGEMQSDGTYVRLGTDAIATKLDSLGIIPRQTKNWSKASISDMLRNPTYAGMVRFGYDKEVKVVQNNKIVKVRRRNSECILVKGLHPAIVTMELFETAQKIKAQNKKKSVPSALLLQNPLSGIVYCAKCGALMTRLGPNSRNRYATLKCPNKYCDNISAPLFLIEEELIRFLTGWLTNYKLYHEDSSGNPLDTEIELHHRSLDNLSKEYATLQKQLNTAYTLLEQGIYSIDVFRQRENLLNQDMQKLKDSEDKLQNEIIQLTHTKYNQERLIPTIEHLLDNYETNSADANNQILRQVIDRVEYLKIERNTRGQLHNTNFTLQVHPRVPS